MNYYSKKPSALPSLLDSHFITKFIKGIKRKSFIVQLIAIALTISSCTKEKKPEVIFTKTEPLKTIWVKPLANNGEPGSLSVNGFRYKDHIYFSNEFTAELIGYPIDEKQEVVSLAKGNFRIQSVPLNYVLDGNSLYFRSSENKIQVLNMDNGNVNTLFDSGSKYGFRMSYDSGKLYFNQYFNENTLLLRMDVNTLQLDTVASITLPLNWQGSLEPPLIFNHQGKRMLAFQLIADGPFPLTYNRVDYYLYDEDANKMVWCKEFADSLAGSIKSPTVDNTNIFWMASTSVHAYDLNSGELKWKHTNSDMKGHFHGIMFMHKDQLMVKSDGKQMASLNPKNGNVNWLNKTTGSTPGLTYAIFDEAFCYYSLGEGYFVAVDLNSGKNLMYTQPMVRNAEGDFTMANSIVIDPATRRLYYNNYYSVICSEIAPFDR